MAKRSGKFYRKNEAEVMRSLGLQETVNSGAVWYDKEDGKNDDVLCQLKSTDANSIRIQQQDIHTLLYNASVSHKVPVFAIQFIKSNEVYLLVRPQDMQDIGQYLETGEVPDTYNLGIDLEDFEELEPVERKTVKSSSSAREQFKEEWESKFKKKGKSAL